MNAQNYQTQANEMMGNKSHSVMPTRSRCSSEDDDHRIQRGARSAEAAEMSSHSVKKKIKRGASPSWRSADSTSSGRYSTNFLGTISGLSDNEIVAMLQQDIVSFSRLIRESLDTLTAKQAMSDASTIRKLVSVIVQPPAVVDFSREETLASFYEIIVDLVECTERFATEFHLEVTLTEQLQGIFLGALKSLARLYHGQNALEKARLMLGKALNLEMKVVPRTKEPIAVVSATLNDLAQLSVELFDYEAALAYYKNALNVQLEGLEPDQSLIITTLQNTACLYVQCGKYCDALDVYDHVLLLQQCMEACCGQQLILASTLSSIGLLRYIIKDYRGALRYYHKALKMLFLHYGGNQARHFDIATTLNSIGMVNCELGSHDTAQQLFQLSLEMHLGLVEPLLEAKQPAQTAVSTIANITVQENDSAISSVFYNLAVVYMQKGEDDIAIDFFVKSINYKKAIFGGASKEISTNLQKLGGIHLERREHKIAILYLEEALRMYKESMSTPTSVDKNENAQMESALYHQLVIVGNLHLLCGNIDGMMSCFVEACRLSGRQGSMEDHPNMFTLCSYSLGRAHPPSAPVA